MLDRIRNDLELVKALLFVAAVGLSITVIALVIWHMTRPQPIEGLKLAQLIVLTMSDVMLIYAWHVVRSLCRFVVTTYLTAARA